MAESPFSILSESFGAAPDRYFSRLREQSPVHYEPSIDSYFLSRYRDVKRVLTDHEAFTTETLQTRAEPVMRGPVLAQMTGAEHTAKRKAVVRVFTGEALRHQVRAIRANAAELVAPFLTRGDDGPRQRLRQAPRRPGDAGGPRPGQAGLAAGLRVARRGHRVHHQCRPHSRTAPALSGARRALEGYLVPIIEERRRRPGEDLISALCAAEFDESS